MTEPISWIHFEQMAWFRDDLAAARRSGQIITVFMHADPSEQEEAGEEGPAGFSVQTLGTQLGPNENGRRRPSRHDLKHATR